MAWETEIVEQVRVIINDIESPQVYSDTRIERASIIAAAQSIKEINYNTNYLVDITLQTITPDPTELDPKDLDFINLVSLKCACLILGGELRQYSLSSVTVVDGPSTISIGSIVKNLKDTYETLLKQYDKAKYLYQAGLSGQSITTPTTVSSLYPYQEF